MNKAILVGRLTKDPELKMTENTKREVCQFTIAVNRPYTNEDGERKADFINCVVWDKLAENLSKYQKKGNQVAVEGRIQTRNYEDKDGKKVYVTEVFVSNVTFLDSKGSEVIRGFILGIDFLALWQSLIKMVVSNHNLKCKTKALKEKIELTKRIADNDRRHL